MELASTWLSYRTGLHGHRLPLALASRLSGQDDLWSSEATRRRRRPALPSQLATHLALLTNNCFPPREGIGGHTCEVECRLQARGDRVTVLARGRAFGVGSIRGLAGSMNEEPT